MGGQGLTGRPTHNVTRTDINIKTVSWPEGSE